METWAASTDLVYGVPSLETIAAGVPSQQHAALFGLYNAVGSQRLIKVVSVSVQEDSARTSGVATGLDVRRITAVAHGPAVPAFKLDSSAAALPAQVIASTKADYTGTAIIRRVFSGQQLNPSRAVPYGVYPLSGDRRTALGALVTTGITDAQAQILREGEGIALTCNSLGGFIYPIEVRAEIRVGSDSYLYTAVTSVEAVPAVFAIFNGTGSGVVVTVSRITFAEIMTDGSNAASVPFSLETTSGQWSGLQLAPIPMDTQNKVLPTGVCIALNPGVVTAGPDYRSMATKRFVTGGDKPIRRVATPYNGKGIGLPNLCLQNGTGRNVIDLLHSNMNAGPITLREGEGLALLQRSNSNGFGAYWVQFVFTVQDNLPAGALTGAEVHYAG